MHLRGDVSSCLMKRGWEIAIGEQDPLVISNSIITHAGVSVSGLGGLSGSVMVPVDGDFVVGDVLQPKSPLARPNKALQQTSLHVDSFEVQLRFNQAPTNPVQIPLL